MGAETNAVPKAADADVDEEGLRHMGAEVDAKQNAGNFDDEEGLRHMGAETEAAPTSADVDVDGVRVDDPVVSPQDTTVLRKLLMDLEFESWLTALNKAAPAPGLPAQHCP